MESVAAEKNARLLYSLKERLGANGLGHIEGFFDVEPGWCCPCCYRSKPEIARVDSNGNLLCRLVIHHDHFEDRVDEKLGRPQRTDDWHRRKALEESFIRFPRTLICEDCNVVEPNAKRIVKAPPYFSFAPHEIAAFIIQTPNAPHKLDVDKVQATYEVVRLSMRLIHERLNRLAGDASVQQEEGLKPIGMYVTRVLGETVKAMKENDAE